MVSILGTVYPYDDKAPFVESGMSIRGALEISEDGRGVKCHECGQFFEHLATHVTRSHTGGADYRAIHGINRTTPLIAPALRAELKKLKKREEMAPKPSPPRRLRRSSLANKQNPRHDELANLRGACRAQLTVKLMELASSLGHRPTEREIKAAGMGRWAIEASFQMTQSEALTSLGLTTLKKGHGVKVGDSVGTRVLRLRAKGFSYSAIGKALEISHSTARNFCIAENEKMRFRLTREDAEARLSL